MADEPENLILTMLRDMREENARYRQETKAELGEVRDMIGSLRVVLTSLSTYIFHLEERVDALEKGK